MTGKMTRRGIIVAAGIAAILAIAVVMIALLTWQGLAARSRIDTLNDTRTEAFLNVEEDWGKPQKGEMRTLEEVSPNDIYAVAMINGEQEEIAATYDALIEKESTKFVVVASLVLSVGLGLIALVVFIDVCLMLRTPPVGGGAKDHMENEPK